MDFKGWRDKDDSDPTKKRARVLHGLATMEHKATCGNSFADSNGLPSLHTQFGKGHARSRSKKMKPPSKAAGKAFLEELKSFMSFTQGGVIESVAHRKQRFTTFVLSQSSNESDVLQKINASELRRSQYVHVPCGTPLPIEHRDDFIDALPISSSSSSAPPPRTMDIGPCPTSTKNFATPKGLYPMGTCAAMQTVSDGHQLFYSRPETYNISTMTDVVGDRTPGVVLLDKHGHVEALRLEKALELNQMQQKQLVNLFQQATRVCVKLGRGQSTAHICKSFVVLGHKKERFENGSNTHSALKLDPKDQARFASIQGRIRAFFKKIILQNMKKVFYLEITAIEMFFKMYGLDLYYGSASSCTIGQLFWPRSHTDADAFYSLLPVVDTGAGIRGGDFAFPEVGRVLKAWSGSIFLYHPQKYHGTTKFSLDRGSRAARFMASFYLKEAVVNAMMASKTNATL